MQEIHSRQIKTSKFLKKLKIIFDCDLAIKKKSFKHGFKQKILDKSYFENEECEIKQEILTTIPNTLVKVESMNNYEHTSIYDSNSLKFISSFNSKIIKSNLNNGHIENLKIQANSMNLDKNVFDQTSDEKISAYNFSEKVTSDNELTCQQYNDINNIKCENILSGNICSNDLLLEDESSNFLKGKIKLEEENKNVYFIKNKEQAVFPEKKNKFNEYSLGLYEKDLKTLDSCKPDHTEISSIQQKIYNNISSKEHEKTKKIDEKGGRRKLNLESLFIDEINKFIKGNDDLLTSIIQKIFFIMQNLDNLKYKSFPNSWNILKKMLKAVGFLERDNTEIKKPIQIIKKYVKHLKKKCDNDFIVNICSYFERVLTLKIDNLVDEEEDLPTLIKKILSQIRNNFNLNEDQRLNIEIIQKFPSFIELIEYYKFLKTILKLDSIQTV